MLPVCLVQLVDDKYNIGGSGSGKGLHNLPRLRVHIDARTAGQRLRIPDSAHIQHGAGKFQNLPDCIRNSGLSRSGRSDQQQPVGRKCMRPVDLYDGFNDSLFDIFQPVELLIQYFPRLPGINRRKIRALPTHIQHEHQCALGMIFLFRADRRVFQLLQRPLRPVADLTGKRNSADFHKALNAIQRLKPLLFRSFLLRKYLGTLETMNQRLQKAVIRLLPILRLFLSVNSCRYKSLPLVIAVQPQKRVFLHQ